jgi:expansin (peptidoglycan-binding protein)
VQSRPKLRCLAIALFGCGVATASLAAVPETGCPGSWAGAGEATYYEAFLQPNACSLPLSPDLYVVAVTEAAFDGSAACGRCLRVTGPLGSIVARITDYCVGSGCHDLDLSPNAFAAIGNPIDGIIPVGWESVSCDTAGPIAFYFDPGSNPYYAKIQVRNHRYGIAGLEIAESGQPFAPLARSTDNAFEFVSGGGPIAAPLALRVTDLHGAILESNGIAFTPGETADGAGQFPFCPEPGSALGGAVGVLTLLAARRNHCRGGIHGEWPGYSSSPNRAQMSREPSSTRAMRIVSSRTS